eukprot:137807_1
MFRTLHVQSSSNRRRIFSRCHIQILKQCSKYHHHSPSGHQHISNPSSISYYHNMTLKRSLSSLPSSTSPIKSLINRLQTNPLLHRPSILNIMHQWIPKTRHYQHTSPLSHLAKILFNTTKTPRGFGQFSKKTKASKKSDSNQSPSSDPKPKQTETTSKSDSTQSSSAEKPKQTETTSSKDKKPKETVPKEKKSSKLFSSKTSKKQSENAQDESGPQKPWYEQIPPWVYIAPLVALLLFGPNITYNTSSNAITFQQFKIHLLEQGLVDHIEVVNKTTARVFLRTNMTGSGRQNTLDDSTTDSIYGNYSPNKVYEFNIGDIQTFEEKLEHAQITMAIEPRDWVNVQYITEISIRDSLFSFISSGPILTLFIFWWVIRMFRKSGAFGLPGTGAGGQKGGGFGGMGGLFDVTRANYKVINKGE